MFKKLWKNIANYFHTCDLELTAIISNKRGKIVKGKCTKCGRETKAIYDADENCVGILDIPKENS